MEDSNHNGSRDRSGFSEFEKTAVQVDAELNLPLAQFGGEGLQFVDEDDDQNSRLDSNVEISKSNIGYAFRNSLLRNSYSPLVASNFVDERVDNSRASSGASVVADIDSQNIDSQNFQDSDEVEYGEVQNLRQQVPEPQIFDGSIFTAPNARPRKNISNSRDKQLGDTNLDALSHQIATLRHFQEETEFKLECPANKRPGRQSRRKTKQDHTNVVRSEEMEGYRGDQDVDTVVQWIEGGEEPPKKQPGKKSKKKANQSGDRSVPKPKAVKSNSSGSTEDITPENISSSLEKLSFGDTPAGENSDIGRSIASEYESALIERMEAEELALRGDLSSKSISIAETNGSVEEIGKTNGTTKSTIHNSNVESSLSSDSQNTSSTATTESEGQADVAVSLPPIKSGSISSITPTLNAIDFMCTSPDITTNFVGENIVFSNDSVIDDSTLAAEKEANNETILNPIPRTNSVLQMIFDSCENGDIPSDIMNQTVMMRSSIHIESGDSVPAVQFLGKAASQSNSTCISTFIFGETADYFNVPMTKSLVDAEKSIGNGILNLLRPRKSQENLSCDTMISDPNVGNSGVMQSQVPNDTYPNKMFREMLEFANKAVQAMDAHLRSLIKHYMDSFQWDNALFWADTMMTLSSGSVDDVLTYVRCLMEVGQHLRALSLLENRGILKSHKVFQYLGAHCFFASHRYEDVVQLIEGPLLASKSNDISSVFNTSCRLSVTLSQEDMIILTTYASEWKVEAGLLLILGKSYEKLENRLQAASAYKQCLSKDPTCVEAFDRLIRHHMLTETEERELLYRLFKDQDNTPQRPTVMAKLLEFLYKNKAAISTFSETPVDNLMDQCGISGDLKKKLSTNLSVMAGEAERLYYQSNCRESYNITTKILHEEEYHSDALSVHVANLVALSKTTELFSLSHKLVDSFPDLLISWYAVACYYYSIENYEAAKRFFHKCTLLDAQHGASWIGYGHSFAIEQEHDQAMNCYVKAAKVMSSCHLPLMYVGLEYSLTNNLRLAEKFFSQACTMSSEDPCVLHELGVLYFRLENFNKAEEYFKKAEKIMGSRTPWEQLLNNLGHVMRKLKKYNESLEYHRRALRLSPRNASTLAAIGYLHMFLEQFDVAVEYFHQSLSLRRDDAFVTGLLNKAMDILNETWRTSFPEPPTLTVPKLKVQEASPKKSKVEKSDTDDGQSDVEMEDA